MFLFFYENFDWFLNQHPCVDIKHRVPLTILDYHIQCPWQFWTTNSCFWLVNILLILHQKGNENVKLHENIKSRCKHKVVFLFSTHPTYPWCNMLQTWERRANMKWCHFVRRTHSKTMTVCQPAKDIFEARRKHAIFRTSGLIPRFNFFCHRTNAQCM